MDSRKSDFFRSVFGYLIKCDSIQEVEKIAEDFFVVICSKFADKDAVECLNRLVHLISTHEFINHGVDDGHDGNIRELLDNQDEITSYKKTASFIWINSIYEAAVQRLHDRGNPSKCVDNLFYTSSPSSIRFILRTLCRIPLWSNIMNGKFKSENDCATSSGSESEFKNIKRLLGNRPSKVDKFVKYHLSHLSGHLTLALSDQRKSELRASKLAEVFQSAKPKLKRSRSASSSSSDSVFPKKRASSSCAPSSSIKRKKLHRSCSDLSFISNDSPSPPMKTERSFESQPNLSISSTDWPKKAEESSALDSSKLASHQSTRSEDQTPSLAFACDKLENDTSLDSLCDKITDENWKGKNQKEALKKGRSRHSILDPHTIFLRRNRAAVPLLKNGYSSKRNSLTTVNTCGFDFIFSVFASAFADYDSIEELVVEKSTENSFFALIKNAFGTSTRNIPTQIYEDRNSLLKQIYTCDDYFGQRCQTKNLLFIDCETGVGGLLSHLIKHTTADLASVILLEQCQCLNMQPKVHPLIALHQRGIKLNKLNNYIAHEIYQNTASICKTCKSIKNTNFIFSKIICLEVEPISRHIDNKICFRELTQHVNISNKTYGLFGIIEMIGVNHFIAHVKRRQLWQTFNDLDTSSSKQSFHTESEKLQKRIIRPYMLFFIDESIQNS